MILIFCTNYEYEKRWVQTEIGEEKAYLQDSKRACRFLLPTKWCHNGHIFKTFTSYSLNLYIAI